MSITKGELIQILLPYSDEIEIDITPQYVMIEGEGKIINNPHFEDQPVRHNHDCKSCVYLGHHKDRDLYFCPGNNKTVIARFGEDGDYESGINFALDKKVKYKGYQLGFGSDALHRALTRAIEMNLITWEKVKKEFNYPERE